MTEDQLLGAAEAYEEERSKWIIRTNKTEDFPFQVTRVEDEPVVYVGARTMEIAEHELSMKRGRACMRAALAVRRG